MIKQIVSKRKQYELFCEANTHQDWYNNTKTRIAWFEMYWDFELEEGILGKLLKDDLVEIIDEDITIPNTIDNMKGIRFDIESTKI